VDAIDLAIVGAGAAGTYVAHEISLLRPDWSVELFERTSRVGGRLRSVTVPGVRYPIELGGMRYYSNHPLVSDLVTRFGIPTRPFGVGRGPDRLALRGHVSAVTDPEAGARYDLAEDERGLSAGDLTRMGFERILPGSTTVAHDGWAAALAGATFGGRPLADWSMREALSQVLSADGYRFVNEAFGYDSGVVGFNVADALPYMLGAGHPGLKAIVPDAGMDRIATALSNGFVARGGKITLEHELLAIELASGAQRLTFANGRTVIATRVVLALPAPALRLLAAHGAAPLRGPRLTALLDTVDDWPATKLYLWYERPWWRDDGFIGVRTITDLAPRKAYYFDEPGDTGPAVMLAAYTDGLPTATWQELSNGSPAGAAASAAMLAAVRDHLRVMHPATDVPDPLGSAFIDWGADPHETGWHFWRAGARSNDVIASIVQPHERLAFFICGEAFSRSQAWVEGALETGAVVVDRLTRVER
jgi:monoamine oxidase